MSWGSRAPAGFRVGAGHGALIEYSLTRGGVAVQAPQASLWAPLTQPKTQAGPAVACPHSGPGPPWWPGESAGKPGLVGALIRVTVLEI